MSEKAYKYEMNGQVVQYLLEALNRVSLSGVQNAKNLIAVTELLQNPLNGDELEKETFEALKSKFEPKEPKKSK